MPKCVFCGASSTVTAAVGKDSGAKYEVVKCEKGHKYTQPHGIGFGA